MCVCAPACPGVGALWELPIPYHREEISCKGGAAPPPFGKSGLLRGRSVCVCVGGWVGACVCGWVHGWVGGWVGGWVRACLRACVCVCVCVCVCARNTGCIAWAFKTQTPHQVNLWSVEKAELMWDAVQGARAVLQPLSTAAHCHLHQQTERRPGLIYGSRGVFFHRFSCSVLVFVVLIVCVCVYIWACSWSSSPLANVSKPWSFLFQLPLMLFFLWAVVQAGAATVSVIRLLVAAQSGGLEIAPWRTLIVSPQETISQTLLIP